MDWGCQRNGCHSLLASYPLSLAAFWASQGCQGVLPAGIPTWARATSPSAAGPIAECLPESSLAAGRGRRAEVRRRLGAQLQQPRVPFPSRARASGAEEAPAGRPELPPGREAHEAARPAILHSQPQHLGSILRARGLMPSPHQARPKATPPPSRLPPYLAPDRRRHTLYPSGSPGRRLTTMLLAVA